MDLPIVSTPLDKKSLQPAEAKTSVISFNNVDIDGEEINSGNKNQNSPGKEDELNNALKEDKSNINLDLTRKMGTMMDFSVILNKRNSDATNMDFGLDRTELGNFANDNWEISCIGKN
jgi:hypothetical protein